MNPETDTSDKFWVEPYSIDNFKKIVNAFNNIGHSTPVDYQNNPHFSYFEEYFNELDAQTIVVERYYIDRDYLQDYSGYYVRCFKRYRRRCVRLHFFSMAFDAEDFKQVYFNKGRLSHALLQEEYIGFVVIKPLPKTIFGRTCLKTYGRDQGRRHYITRKYDVNLYGLELKVDSLAYQEQDRIAAACATSALWSVFQFTGVQFQHQILSPLEITEAACINFPTEERSIPNEGLGIDQMVHSIYSVGLEPYIAQVRGVEDVKNETYALLKGGIPMILGLALVNTSKTNGNPGSDVMTDLDMHAVAVTGYSLGGGYCLPSAESGILLESSRLDKLYCHDDQIGPFSRIVFHGEKIMDVIFDATDLEQGKKLHCLLVYSQPMYEAICTHFDEKKDLLKNQDLWSPIFDWFYDKYGKDMKIQ